jgi:diguanylate cyclase (GGDEF)-like protein
VGTLSTGRNRALLKVDNATAALRADIERRELIESELRQRKEDLHVMALTDSLTGLTNRRAFLDQLKHSHARALRSDTELIVLFADVDDFKTINDTYGHAAGDAVLKQVANRLRGHFGGQDTIARISGNEFAIICKDASPEPPGPVERLRLALAAPYSVNDRQVEATVSVWQVTPQEGESSDQLLERADGTMDVGTPAPR